MDLFELLIREVKYLLGNVNCLVFNIFGKLMWVLRMGIQLKIFLDLTDNLTRNVFSADDVHNRYKTNIQNYRFTE